MNILQTETLYGWGGQQKKVLLESIALKELGHNVSLLCNPGSNISEAAEKHGIPIYLMAMSKKNYPITIFRLIKLIKDQDIDLIISHGSTDSWIAALASRLSRRKPVFFRERHNLFPINGWLSRLQHRQLAHKILSISQSVSDYLVSVGVSRLRLLSLPDAIDPTDFQSTPTDSSLRNQLGIPSDAVVLGSLTSHRKDKGVYDLAQLCRSILPQNKNVWFIFAGPYKPQDRDQIELEILNSDAISCRITWTGYRSDVQNTINAFDIFVHLTKTEGLGTVTIEAMYCKKPIIAWEIPAMRELMPNNKHGVLAPYHDFKRLTQLTQELINNRQLRESIGSENRALVENTYSFASLKERLRLALSLI